MLKNKRTDLTLAKTEELKNKKFSLAMGALELLGSTAGILGGILSILKGDFLSAGLLLTTGTGLAITSTTHFVYAKNSKSKANQISKTIKNLDDFIETRETYEEVLKFNQKETSIQ